MLTLYIGSFCHGFHQVKHSELHTYFQLLSSDTLCLYCINIAIFFHCSHLKCMHVTHMMTGINKSSSLDVHTHT